MAHWNLICQQCNNIDEYSCSIFNLPLCKYCGGEQLLTGSGRPSKSTIFPFSSKHITPDGSQLIIESLPHLRKVEKEYGVVLSAFSNEVNNSVDSLKGSLPKYRGNDEDFNRDHRK